MVQAVAGQENTDPNAEHASKPGKRRSQQRNKKAAKRSLLEPASEHSLTGSEASTVTCLQEGQRPTSRAARDVGVTQGPTTFDQVASLRAARSSSQDVLSHMGSLLHTQFSFPLGTSQAANRRIPAAKSSQASKASATQAAPTVSSCSDAAGKASTSGTAQLPMDWSLKTLARFSAASEITCCTAALAASGAQVSGAIRSFAGGHSISSSAQQQLLQSLMSWQYPGQPLPQAAAQHLGGHAAGLELLQARKAAWQEAFLSLKAAVRSSACDCFYVLSPAGAKKPWAAFFGAAGVGARPRMHAWLSHTQRGLRAVLRQQYRLHFTLPCCPALEEADQAWAAAADKEDAALEALPQEDSTAKSLALFSGAASAQGLADYLLHSVTSDDQALDVPLLLASSPFVHASLQQTQPQVLPAAAGKELSASRFELRGMLPPWVVHRTLSTLQEWQCDEVQVTLETDVRTTLFNVKAEGPSPSGPVQETSSAYAWSAAESGAVRASTIQLAGRVLKTVVIKDGLIHTRMA